MEIKLRQEVPSDHAEVTKAIMDAYADIPYSDHKEQHMVDRLRRSEAFIPQLSIVAYDEQGTIAGHILLTRIRITKEESGVEVLALAPLSVRTAYQQMGIGEKLILESHRIAKTMGYNFIVILGIPNYYRRFGYQFASKYDLRLPIEIGGENAFVIALHGNDYAAIKGGTVEYSKEFFGVK